MKKFYSLVLMAAALLIGTNAWAVSVSTLTQLQSAIDNTPVGGTVDITLTADVTVTASATPIQIYAKKGEAGKTVNIDLNGKNIASSGTDKPDVLIELFKGTLNLIGQGGVTTNGRTAIKVYGYEDPTAANWAVLNVGKKVTVSSTKKEAIGVYGFYGPRFTYAYHGSIDGGDITPSGYSGKTYDGTDGAHYFNDADNYAKVNESTNGSYGKSIKSAGHALVTAGKIDYVTSYPAYYGWAWSSADPSKPASYRYKSGSSLFCYHYEKSKAYGVQINVEGTLYGYEYGIKLNGTLKYADAGNWPSVHIKEGAEVSCDATNPEGTAVYASGCATWLIEGYVHGNIGVYVKSGTVTLNNAVVESTNTTGTHHDVTGTTSGIEGGEGSAIVVESNSNYLGGQTVVVTGDTKVTGANGYAVEEVITNTDNSKVTQIDIQGGTFVEGANGEGAMQFTDKTTGEEKVTIYGANVEGAVAIGSEDDKLSDLIPAGTHITEVTNADGSKTLVVSEGDAPEADETGTWSKITTNAAAHPSDTVNAVWTELDQTAEITTHMILGELHMTSAGAGHKQTIHVNDGAILDVRRVILNDRAEIIVEAGGQVIVYGEQGIVAPVVSNIVLKNEGALVAADRKFATFLFNPAVTSNRHPNATVEMTTYSFGNGADDYQWERFGIPTWKALKSINYKTPSTVRSRFTVFDVTTWKELGALNPKSGEAEVNKADFNKPFATYNLLAYRASDAAAPTYQFAGELVGNIDASLDVTTFWTPFTNSYSANLSLPALFAAVKAGTIIDEYIYVAQPQGLGTYYWKAWDAQTDNFNAQKLAPMQAFMLKKVQGSTQTEAVAVNYKTMVYNPATTPSLAPRRQNSSDFTARMCLVVSNVNGICDELQLRETATLTKEAEKYMNSDVNIYAMTDGKATILAVENLENTYVGFSTVKGGNFTLNFANVMGTEYTLIDHETGARVAMVEGGAYEFTAAANSANDYRFEVVATAKVPTAIDNTEAVKSVKGIYTITGQYVGEMNVWNTLPAGVYVVNGEKRVK